MRIPRRSVFPSDQIEVKIKREQVCEVAISGNRVWRGESNQVDQQIIPLRERGEGNV